MLLPFAAALLLALAGCPTTSPGPSAAVVSVVIDQGVVTLVVGTSTALSVTVMTVGGASDAVAWSSDDESIAAVSAEGVVTGVAAGATTIRATSTEDEARTASVSVTVIADDEEPEEPGEPDVEVSILPTIVELAPLQAQTFTATVTGTNDTNVTWSTTCGTIDGTTTTITYTAPADAGECTVTATSTADPTKAATATITVTPAPVVHITVEPATATMTVNETQAFTATVTGADDTTVSWSTTCGTIDGTTTTITYTAPADAGECTVTATSTADPTKSAPATVTVELAVGGFERAPSYISISNVSVGPASGGTRRVTFDISWPESWRGPSRPSWVEASDNWDAAWVFMKYRVAGGAWQHATLAGSGHVVPSGAVVDVPGDRVGAFLYRSGSGYGTFTANGVGLQWDHLADGIPAGARVEMVPFAIEMVYVPEGSFSLGSGHTRSGEFRAGGTTDTPFVVSSQSPISLGDASGQLTWTEFGARTGTPSGSTHPGFPTGYAAFYVMKRELAQGEYVNFLNSLSQSQADARKHTGSSFRFAITGSNVGSYVTSLPFVALNFVSWADGAAFTDWAGLRPMTELEFEKAARGPLAPMVREYAWGSLSRTQATGLANAGTLAETPTPAAANAVYGGIDEVQGPVRVGSFAAPGRSRRDAGAGYYGALELSGNLWERAVTVGNAEGRAFAGTHGDGSLDAGGSANVASWPHSDAGGAGLRGGSWRWTYLADYLPVSDRDSAALARVNVDRRDDNGWRAARSAP